MLVTDVVKLPIALTALRSSPASGKGLDESYKLTIPVVELHKIERLVKLVTCLR